MDRSSQKARRTGSDPRAVQLRRQAGAGMHQDHRGWQDDQEPVPDLYLRASRDPQQPGLHQGNQRDPGQPAVKIKRKKRMLPCRNGGIRFWCTPKDFTGGLQK